MLNDYTHGDQANMKYHVAILLKEKAAEVARRYSNKARERNTMGDTFTVKEIRPLSEAMAAVFFSKTSGKLMLGVFFYLETQKRWDYFLPTDSHLLGLADIPRLKAEVEKFNFAFNVEDGDGDVPSEE